MSTRTFINVDYSVSSSQPNHITGTLVTNSSTRLGLDVNMVDGVDRLHLRTHQGKAYSLSSVQSLAGNASLYYLIDTTSTGSNLHCGFQADVTENARLELFEGSTVSSNGTAATPINTNRQSTNVPLHKFYSGPTVSNIGSTLTSVLLAAGAGNFAGGGAGGSLPKSGAEWILANTQKYIFSVTNLTAQTITVGMALTFYEN